MAGMLNSNNLKVGVVFVDDGATYSVIKYQHIKKGRGQATIRVKVRNIENGVIIEKTYSNEQKLELADVEKRSAQYLYRDDENIYFMDTENYSQFSLPASDLEWERNFLVEEMKVVTQYLNERPINIELPKTVDLKVTETQSAVAGNTATNATKDATFESGYVGQVPLFIKEGELLKVNTETGEYISRA